MHRFSAAPFLRLLRFGVLFFVLRCIVPSSCGYSRRAHILKYFGENTAPKDTQFESLLCQEAWCLFGDPGRGYCHKCATPDVPVPDQTTCKRIDKLSRRLSATPQPNLGSIELLRIPGSIMQESNGELAINPNRLPLASPSVLKRCKQTTSENGPVYMFHAIVGMMVSKTKKIAWTSASTSKTKQRFGISWGAGWHFTSAPNSPDSTWVSSTPQSVSTQFPREAVKEFDKDVDHALLYMDAHYVKPVSLVKAASRSLFSSMFSLVRPANNSPTPQGPTATNAVIPLIKLSGQSVASSSNFKLPEAGCVIITCQRDDRPRATRSLWLARVRKQLQKFSSALNKTFPLNKGAGSSLANESQQKEWLARTIESIRSEIQTAQVLSSQQVAAQEKSGELWGLSESCRTAASAALTSWQSVVQPKKEEKPLAAPKDAVDPLQVVFEEGTPPRFDSQFGKMAGFANVVDSVDPDTLFSSS